jgi:hypothetical protein
MYNTAIYSDISPLRQAHEAPVYFPTLEEFNNFPKFIEKIERDGSDQYGIVRVVPPIDWEYKNPKKLEPEILNKTIIPVKQYTSGRLGAFRVDLVESKKRTVEEYRQKAFEKEADISKFLSFNQTLHLYPYMNGVVNILHRDNDGSGNSDIHEQDNAKMHGNKSLSFKGNWAYNKKQYHDGLVGNFEYNIDFVKNNKNSIATCFNGCNAINYDWDNVPSDAKIESIIPHKATGSFTTAVGENVKDQFDFYCIKIFHNTDNRYFYIVGEGQCKYGTYRLFGTLQITCNTCNNTNNNSNNANNNSNKCVNMILSREYFQEDTSDNTSNSSVPTTTSSSSLSSNTRRKPNKMKYSIREHLLMMKYQLTLRDESIVEKEFWRSITSLSKDIPMYGADQVGTIFKDQPANGWNVSKLDTILRIGLPQEMPGITKPMLYFGQYRAIFSWHKEDYDLNSINFLHHGKPKFWYAVCRPSAKRFESLCKSMFGDEANKCPEFMRHKNIFISPKILKKEKIQYVSTVQHENEFILTFPNGYHAGFNTGFNVAESVNFSSPKWISYGRKCNFCRCFPYTFRMDIDHFCEMIRHVAPNRLPKIPTIGDRILISWDKYKKPVAKSQDILANYNNVFSYYFLCRVKKGTHGNKFNVQGFYNGESFVLPFDPDCDNWKWNVNGDNLDIGISTGSKSKDRNARRPKNKIRLKRKNRNKLMTASDNNNRGSSISDVNEIRESKKSRTTLVLKRKINTKKKNILSK